MSNNKEKNKGGAKIGNKNAVKAGEKATANILLRVTPSHKAELQGKAEKAGVSLSKWIMMRCEDS